jgi:hypothetical protein
MASQKKFNSVDSKEHTSTFLISMKVDAMSGAFFTQYHDRLEKSHEEVVDSLKNDLLSGDPERQRLAAALVRMSYDIRGQAIANGRGVVTMVDGVVTHEEPDSPVFPDLSSLVPLVKELFPLPPDKEPPGFE